MFLIAIFLYIATIFFVIRTITEFHRSYSFGYDNERNVYSLSFLGAIVCFFLSLICIASLPLSGKEIHIANSVAGQQIQILWVSPFISKDGGHGIFKCVVKKDKYEDIELVETAKYVNVGSAITVNDENGKVILKNLAEPAKEQ